VSGALDRHSTRAVSLKPTAIAAAAVADLVLREQKRAGKSDKGRPYLFHRRHVQRSTCPLDLVDRAIADRYSGIWSAKRVTRLIYLDEDLLRATRALLSPLEERSAS